MILKGLPADPELSVMQSRDPESQSQESGWQLGRLSFEEVCYAPNAAAPSFALGFWKRSIALYCDEHIRQGRFDGFYRRIDLRVRQEDIFLH
jgi:hypothetical protein